ISGEQNVRSGDPRRRGVPADRKGDAAHRRARQRFEIAVERAIELAPGRMERVGAEIDVRTPTDQARERPAIAAHAAAQLTEIEFVAALAESVPDRVVDRHVAHDRAADALFGRSEKAAAHDAAGTVGRYDDACVILAARGGQANALVVARDADDRLVLAQRDAARPTRVDQ